MQKGRREERNTLYTDAALRDGEGGIAVVQGGSARTLGLEETTPEDDNHRNRQQESYTTHN
ncbi:hypothetical protein D6C99_10561 [Aureobasidium pullulans]|nr:hypothetical protein D6C99_10561 [Aureobasidium pullulans]